MSKMVGQKRMDLSEGSKSYHEEADIYERFSQVEDTPGKVLGILKPVVEGMAVLDMGCGTGKYMVPLAPLAKIYIGLDISADQLAIARKKSPGSRLICSSAEDIPLPDKSVDVAISAWVLGTIQEEDRREKALKEAMRVTRKAIYLVENDVGGGFEEIRGRYPDARRTEAYNDWLKSHGFRVYRRVDSWFGFKDKAEAQSIMGSIWGEAAASKVGNSRIGHRIVIYRMDM